MSYTLVIWLVAQGHIIAQASHAFGSEAMCSAVARDMRTLPMHEPLGSAKRIVFCIGPNGPEA